jgi:hypothetical protein
MTSKSVSEDGERNGQVDLVLLCTRSIPDTRSFGRQMYCVGLFVTRPTHPKSLASTANGGPKSGTISGASTPLTRKLATTRADGSIVHAVSVSTFCFKLGRLSEWNRVPSTWTSSGTAPLTLNSRFSTRSRSTRRSPLHVWIWTLLLLCPNTPTPRPRTSSRRQIPQGWMEGRSRSCHVGRVVRTDGGKDGRSRRSHEAGLGGVRGGGFGLRGVVPALSIDESMGVR